MCNSYDRAVVLTFSECTNLCHRYIELHADSMRVVFIPASMLFMPRSLRVPAPVVAYQKQKNLIAS